MLLKTLRTTKRELSSPQFLGQQHLAALADVCREKFFQPFLTLRINTLDSAPFSNLVTLDHRNDQTLSKAQRTQD